MSLEIEVDVQKRRVRVRWTGPIGDIDLLKADDEFRAHPLADPSFDQLIDMREASEGEITRSGLQSLTERTPYFVASSRRAAVVPTDLGFGLGRMFEQMRGGDAGEIRVFRELADAERWLDEGPAPSVADE